MDPMVLAKRLKPLLVDFALSPRFDHELSAVIERDFPGGLVTDESMFSMTLDRFILQHRLPSGESVVDIFAGEHPELTDSERDVLMGWRDVVESVFEIKGKDRDAVVLFNFLDELTYTTRSNMGSRAFRPLKKGMVLVGRVVRLGEGWMLSGNPAAFPASYRDQMLAFAVQEAMRHPEAVFRNPEKLASARQVLASQHQAFTDMFGADLIVVPSTALAGRVEAFHLELARRAGANTPQHALLEFPEEVLDADTVAIHFVADEGLSFYPDYHLLEELFAGPGLIARRRYRENLSGFLGDPDLSPDPLRRLAARDPAKASKVFTRLLKRKRGFSWETDGEELLRKYKPGYFDGTRLPRTVPLPDLLADVLRRSQELPDQLG